MTLPQQLEDKKKGCNLQFSIPKGKKGLTILICNSEHICKTCQAEIAILEQAITEIKKQRKEEIEYFENVMISINNRINRLKEQQLNQPKTEK